MKRAKYKAKNINEFKRFRTCTHPHCDEHGIVSYRNDTDGSPCHVEYRCIPHVNWTKQPTEPSVKAAKNRYVKLTDIDKLLSLGVYHARG